METGQIIRLKIEDMAKDGQGVGKTGGFAVFVKGAVLGDEVAAEITKVNKNFALAKTVKMIAPSKDRTEPCCKYAGICGGCPYSGIRCSAQSALKEKQVYDCLARIGGLANPKINRILAAGEIFRYRNKASMPVSSAGPGAKGLDHGIPGVSIGFYKAKSHRVVDCRDCLLQTEPAMEAAEALRQFMVLRGAAAYSSEGKEGIIRRLTVKTARASGEVMAIIEIDGRSIQGAEKLVEMMDGRIDLLPEREDGVKYSLASVVLNIRQSSGGRDGRAGAADGKYVVIAGKPVISEETLGLKFRISPGSFYQVNPAQAEKLYKKALEYAGLRDGERVLDLYCGTGPVALLAAKAGAGRVIGIEASKSAVTDANRNAMINNMANVQFVAGKAEDALPRLLTGEGLDDVSLKVDRADVVFLDPPRGGCGRKALDAVAMAEPERVVYISCDPATLARDVRYLTGKGYVFAEGTPVDMFPWTESIECVCLLTKPCHPPY